MPKVAYGTTRTVLLLWRYAFKVPAVVEWRLFLLGLLGNMQETKFSKCGWPELCPVVFSIPGGFLVVMRRAVPITREQWFELDEVALDEFMTTATYRLPVELKMDSFGMLDNKMVAVDYGS
jgi:hypothetical protein